MVLVKIVGRNSIYKIHQQENVASVHQNVRVHEKYEPVHEIWYISHVRYAPTSLRHAYAATKEAGVLNFCPDLHQLPYFVCTSSKGSGETARMSRLA